jgi:hypothetical protein
MINACRHLQCFASGRMHGESAFPLLQWADKWQSGDGHGVVLGLIDTGLNESLPDLEGADLTVRAFAEAPKEQLVEHGTYSVALLVGQGACKILGIAPRARLLLATVSEPDGAATPKAVAEAIEWLLSFGAMIIAIPFGGTITHDEIARQIEDGSSSGVTFLAAAGNAYPEFVVFPARHPLCIAVGAAARDGSLLPECSRLPRLDLVAPGKDIAAPIRSRLVRRRRGSSVACVVAAGAATRALSAGALPTGSSTAHLLEALRPNRLARAPP